MIQVTKLDHSEILLNSDLIEHIEETPDTVIVLVTGQAFRVRESMEQLRQKIIDFRRSSGHGSPPRLFGAELNSPGHSYGEST